LTACGTFQLASGVIPLSAKSQQQQELDNLSCKDQAKLEANTAGRQAGAFALGFTIIGAPLAFELEKTKQREVYKICMEGKGYSVMAPSDGNTASNQQPQLAFIPLPQLGPPPKAATNSPQSVPSSAAATLKDEATQLQKLKDIFEKGLISKEEYEAKRKTIIDRL